MPYENEMYFIYYMKNENNWINPRTKFGSHYILSKYGDG